MDEQAIRRIVQQEIQKNKVDSRFGLNPIVRHVHNGVDSPQISQNNIIPSVSVSGSITSAQKATYLIQLNSSFTPSRILAYGNIVGTGGEKFLSVGSANLGPSFFLQPGSTTSVVTGSVQYPRATTEFPSGNVPLQSSSYFGIDGAGTAHTIVSEGHIVSVAYPSATIHARATVVGFSKSGILVTVSDLDAGWSMNINYVIS